VDDFALDGKQQDSRKLCVARGTACPCGLNTLSCDDLTNAGAKDKICVPKSTSLGASSCPLPCSPTQITAGNRTCRRKNLDNRGKFVSETETCTSPRGCAPGSGQKRCPTGALINAGTDCTDPYNVLKATRRLSSGVSEGTQQTATVVFFLKDLLMSSSTIAEETRTVKASLDSNLQLTPSLLTTLVITASSSEASVVYKIMNQGQSSVSPAQVSTFFKNSFESSSPQVSKPFESVGTLHKEKKVALTLEEKTTVSRQGTETTTITTPGATETTSTETTSTETTSTKSTTTISATATTTGTVTVTVTTTEEVLERLVTTGDVVLQVSNVTSFTSDPDVRRSLKEGIAGALTGIEPDMVTIIGITASRRLDAFALSEQPLQRRLASGEVTVNYEIDAPNTAAAQQITPSVIANSGAAFQAQINAALTSNNVAGAEVTSIQVSTPTAVIATRTTTTATSTTATDTTTETTATATASDPGLEDDDASGSLSSNGIMSVVVLTSGSLSMMIGMLG